jgi:hypothetical protein
MINSVLKVITGIVKLRGGTDNTVIGNVSDALKVNVSAALPTGTNSIGQVTANAGTNLNTSALALEATQVAQSTLLGAVTETAPANDTASSGLNGRLQRIAQRLTSILTALSDRTQKTQITNGTVDGEILATPVLGTSNGLVVRPIPYEPQTYSAAATGFASAASATDVFTITGSGSKTIRVHSLRVSASTTSGSAIKLNISLIRRSTADSGGTAVAATVVKNDTDNAAGTATVNHYTANPTLGTAVGTMRAVSIAVANNGINGGNVNFDFAAQGQPIILRGTSQQLAVNFGAVTITGAIVSIFAEWSEV